MFSQQPSSVKVEKNSEIQPKQGELGTGNSLETPAKSGRRRKKKKRNNQNKQLISKSIDSESKFTSIMSSWAESFTAAATWQLKHEVAQWKAKAVALEYENKILHDVIRMNFLKAPARTGTVVSESEDDSAPMEEESYHNEDDEEEFEISEDFIEFVRANAKYKEDAKMEREKYKAQQLAKEKLLREEMERPPVVEDHEKNLKDLYGENWQRTAAIEMATEARFIEEHDSNGQYWPAVPLNFIFN